MEFTQIRHLTNRVSRIGLGTWAIGGSQWGGTDEKTSIATIRQALSLGINLIDTAPVYGFGYSEELVGKALKEHGTRDKVVIATKAGIGWEDKQIFRDARKETIIKEVDDSLRRLQTSYIDLYQVHWPDPLVPCAETAEAMLQLQKAGKIRSIGVSNYQIEMMEAFQKKAPIDSLQSPYNLFERGVEKQDLPVCRKNSIAFLAYGPLCRGLLSGKMDKKRVFQGDDLRQVDPKFKEPRFSEYLNCVVKLQEWAKNKYSRPVIALAFRWLLDKGADVILWGCRNPEQLNLLETVDDWKLTHQDFHEIDAIIAETVTHPIGPEFMAPPARKEMAIAK